MLDHVKRLLSQAGWEFLDEMEPRIRHRETNTIVGAAAATMVIERLIENEVDELATRMAEKPEAW